MLTRHLTKFLSRLKIVISSVCQTAVITVVSYKPLPGLNFLRNTAVCSFRKHPWQGRLHIYREDCLSAGSLQMTVPLRGLQDMTEREGCTCTDVGQTSNWTCTLHYQQILWPGCETRCKLHMLTSWSKPNTCRTATLHYKKVGQFSYAAFAVIRQCVKSDESKLWCGQHHEQHTSN